MKTSHSKIQFINPPDKISVCKIKGCDDEPVQLSSSSDAIFSANSPSFGNLQSAYEAFSRDRHVHRVHA